MSGAIIRDLKEALHCSVTTEPMVDPYIAMPCGHSFEKAMIDTVMGGSRHCPLDRQLITSTIPNYTLKSVIERINALGDTLTASEREHEATVERLQQEITLLKTGNEAAGTVVNALLEQQGKVESATRPTLFKQMATRAVEYVDAWLFPSPPPPTSISQEEWVTGVILNSPPQPQALVDFLAGPCPIWPGKKASETHIVVPLFKNFTIFEGGRRTVPRTLKTLDEIDKASGKAGFRYIWDEIVDNPAEEEFHWAVLTKDILPRTKDKTYEVQKQLVEAKGYEVPGILDAATAILWENRYSGERFFSKEPLTYTRCKEEVKGSRLVVGGFASNGLGVNDYRCYDIDGFALLGVAGFRKFKMGEVFSASSHPLLENRGSGRSAISEPRGMGSAGHFPVSSSMSQEAWDTADISHFPPYPQSLIDFLADSSPGLLETYTIVPLFPTITRIENGVLVTVPRTLRTLNQLSGHLAISTDISPKLDEPAEEDFRWAVMCKDAFGERVWCSRHAEIVSRGELEMPSFLDVATAILWEAQRSEMSFLMPHKSWWIGCKDTVTTTDRGNAQVVVGAGDLGIPYLEVSTKSTISYYAPVALRKF